MNVYDFTVKDLNDNDVSLSDFKGKVLLIVNTATHCGFTPQYYGLEDLYEKYSDKGFVILDFPCNQFANQCTGTMQEIVDFCRDNFEVTFPQFQKVDVNGDTASPLFRYLQKAKKGTFGNKIKWNFTKFLIDREGNVVERFAPMITPDILDKEIQKVL